MKTFIALISGLLADAKTAFKDHTDLIMFIIAVALSVADLSGVKLRGAVGFLTFYIFFNLVRIGYLKRTGEQQKV